MLFIFDKKWSLPKIKITTDPNELNFTVGLSSAK
jgi:hypothetical protein